MILCPLNPSLIPPSIKELVFTISSAIDLGSGYPRRRRGYCILVRLFLSVGPICENPEGPLFLPEFVCLCVCGRHFYQLALDNFDETWSQVSYYDSLLPRP